MFTPEKNRSYCAVPENIHTPPTEGIGIAWVGGGGGFLDQKIKDMYEAYNNWNFQRGWEVCIFSGTTHYVPMHLLRMATSLKQPLSCVPKVAVVERFRCN